MEIQNDLTEEQALHMIKLTIRDWAFSIEENAHYSDDNYISSGQHTPLDDVLNRVSREILDNLKSGYY